ncbi:MAG: ABC transporter substrate-binding protein [Chloroflexi bacterium]|nr:ABC transporter substrate-binding protein [Chloroflexota bacterium]
MKKRWLHLAIIVSFMLVTALATVQAQGQPVFRIGVLDRPLGEITKGAFLAIEEINTGGGVQGADGTFFRLELVAQPIANFQTAITNLNQAGIIAVLGPEDNETVLDNLNLLQSLNVPVLTPATVDTLLAADTSGRIFRTRAAEVLRGRALADYLINDLQVQRIATVQLGFDIDVTAGVIGFSEAARALGVLPQPALTVQEQANIPATLAQIIQANPEIVVIYGNPAEAGSFYESLRLAGWSGLTAYNDTDDPAFRGPVAPERLANLISTTTWPFTAQDEASNFFRERYIFTFGEVPDAVAAASYDAVYLLAEAIRRPGELVNNLLDVDNVAGVQGMLNPAELGRGETSNNVAVVQLNAFGVPQVLARFQGTERLAPGQVIPATPTPAATATPQGVVATITRAIQNVRSGPGLAYDVIGQLNQGDQVPVIGANVDFSWLVIQFRGQQGWISRAILDVFGDLNTLPIVQPPPTPTPLPSPTVPPQPDIVIDSAFVTPSPIIPGVPFTVSVTVRNAGGGNAGQFAIAATFPPNNVYASAIVPGLPAGQSTIVNLVGTLANTGYYSVAIVADLNNEVAELNENNNSFNFSYTVNRPTIRQASQTLNPGDTLDLEGNAIQGDVNWDASASALNAIFGAKIAVLPNVNISTIHWDLLDPNVINQTSIPVASLVPGTTIGIITADGNRGVMRVDSLNNNQLTLSFIVFQK